MKTKRNSISRKGLPKDLKRITNRDGKRVWITGGKEYRTLAEVSAAFKR